MISFGVLCAVARGVEFDDDGMVLLQTNIVQGLVQGHSQSIDTNKTESFVDFGFDFDTSRWQQKDGYFVNEQHGSSDECYPTLQAGMDACDKAGDCKAVATQSNVCSGQYRVSHGGPTLIYTDPSWVTVDLRSWAMVKTAAEAAATACPATGICVSSAACGSQDAIGVVGSDCNGKVDCAVGVTEANSGGGDSVSLLELGFVFDASRWQQKDGYFVNEQHGSSDECYPTLQAGMDACDKAGDCKAVATQKNVCSGQYRVSHGGPTFIYTDPSWVSVDLRCWAMVKTAAEAAAAAVCKDGYAIEYTCDGGTKKLIAEGNTATLSCKATPATTTTTTPGTTTEATTTEATTTATTPGSPSGGSTETTTTIPGGDTNVGGADCFGAIATFGPDFECNFKVSSFCAHDSADGLDVSACCQDYCNSNREKTTKRKVSEREDKAAEGVRKSDRQESSSKRKDAEVLRKKNSREAEWLQKRGAQETSNKKAEDERKTKRGYSESKTKNERSWKANRQRARKNAQRREAARKSERALKGRNNGKAEKRTKKKEALAKNTEKRKKINSKGR